MSIRDRKTKIVVLGAGPAGLGAAWQLAKQDKADVTVIEQKPEVGGNAGSFRLAGIPVDFGSHRLHPACDPKILADLKDMLGDDLLDRPRHGRIRLQERWIHFPLKAPDLALRMPLAFGAGVAKDAMLKLFGQRRNGNAHENLSTVLEQGLGPTICREFYFPYAEKVWGLAPNQLSAIQARRRVSAGSLGKMARKVVSLLPGLKSPGAGRFYYPRNGFGQISTMIAAEAERSGAKLLLNSTARKIELGTPHRVHVETSGQVSTIEADHIWSTIPISILSRITDPAPAAVIEASREIAYRAMVLIYLVLETDQWTEFDAHYFPEKVIPLTRLSEPKNYSGHGPQGVTVLCGELPCSMNDDVWTSSDEDLCTVVKTSLERCGLPLKERIKRVVTKRLPFAYPIYHDGYESSFRIQDEWADSLDGVLTFGRQGLFAHDNTHHALAMAYGAVDCLSASGDFDRSRWAGYRTEFAKHIVED